MDNVAELFLMWKEENAKYIEPMDFWPWLEQAFVSGTLVSTLRLPTSVVAENNKETT